MPAAKKPQDHRPSARRVTDNSEKRHQDALDSGVRITFEGREYAVRVGDLTAPVARRLRREAGCSFNSLLQELASDPDIDSVAAVVWLSRVLSGEDIDLEDVAVDYGSLDDLDISVAGAEEVDGGPEA